ncbi:MAG TPA: tripartite tricarboxylate transporter substrate binding protein [Burkholderiales bacterium]
MSTPVRRLGVSMLALLIAAPFSFAATTQHAVAYPARPVRIIVGFTPASSNDILARFVAAKLAERVGQQVVVDNRPGANGIIGTELTARSTPDGHTLMLVSTSHTMNAAVNKLPFDPVKSLTPIAMIGAGPLVLVTNASFSASSVRQLIEVAKAKPKALTYASAGTGGINHFGGALFAHVTGIQMTHVPYKGGAPALTDVIAGQVQLMFGSMPLTLAQIRAGKVKALGVTSAKRSPLLPDLPAIAEAGAPGYEIQTWWGILAPAAVPASIVTKLNTEITAVIRQPDSAQRLEAEGAEALPMSSAEFGRLIIAELDKWARVAREANIRAE